MKNKIGLVFVAIIILGLLAYAGFKTLDIGEEVVEVPVVAHDDDDFNDIDNIDVKETVVIKKVYINEEDYSGYTSDEVGVSYWYVYYQMNNDHHGYKILELDVPYFDLHKAILGIKPNATEKDFVGISFFNRVSFETWQSYKGMPIAIQ